MKLLPKVFSVVSAVLLAFLFVCSLTTPVGPISSNKIKLSINNEGTKSIDFKGKEINLIMVFPDSIIASLGNTFDIHRISGEVVQTMEIINNNKVKQLIIPMYWKSIAYCPYDSSDTSNLVPYDTIYIQSGLYYSNVVTVKIINLPPLITSYTVGDSSYNLQGYIRETQTVSYIISDSTDSVVNLSTVILDSDDPNKVNYNYDIVNPLKKKYLIYGTQDKQRAKYQVRDGNYRDTVSLLISDGDKTIQIKTIFKNLDGTETLLDSIFVEDTLFADTSKSLFSYSSVFIDTINLKFYPHDPKSTVTLDAKNGSVIAGSGTSFIYITNDTTANDTLKEDKEVLVDSLIFTLTNADGDDFSETVILIYHKSDNKRAVVSSLTIDTTVYTSYSADSGYQYLAEAGSDLLITVEAEDPDLSGTITYAWTASSTKGSFLSNDGKSITYTCGNSYYIDTLTLEVIDALGFITSSIIIITVNSAPVIDSIQVDTALYVVPFDTDTLFTYSTNTPATFDIRAYVHDNDTPANDSVTVYWHYKTAKKVIAIDTASVLHYISATDDYSDTLFVIVIDAFNVADTQNVILEFTK